MCLALRFLKNSRLELTSDEMKDNVVDMWEPGENEKHPLNSGVFKAGFACGLFQEANNLLFVFSTNQRLGFFTSFAYRATSFRGAVPVQRSHTHTSVWQIECCFSSLRLAHFKEFFLCVKLLYGKEWQNNSFTWGAQVLCVADSL